MLRIEELVERAVAAAAPIVEPAVEPPQVIPEVSPAVEARDARIDELIAKQREIRESTWVEVPVTVAGEEVALRFGKILGGEFLDLMERFPPREGNRFDATAEFDRSVMPSHWPLERLEIDGEQPSEGLWERLWGVLDAEDRESVSTALWGVHIYDPAMRLMEYEGAQNG